MLFNCIQFNFMQLIIEMDILKLSNQVCFPIYALSRKVTALYQPLLDELGLTYPQYLVMLLLWEYKELTVKEIGGHLMLDSGTLSPLLKKLEQKLVLTRTRNPDDERVVKIALTKKGEVLKNEAAQIPGHLKTGFNCTTEEIMQFQKMLNGFLEKIGKQGGEHAFKEI